MFDSYAKMHITGKAYSPVFKTSKNGKPFVSFTIGVTEKVDGKWGKEFYNVYYYAERAEKVAANMQKNKGIQVSVVCKPIFNDKKITGFFVEELAIANDWEESGTTTTTVVPPPAVEDSEEDNDLPF